MTETPTSGPMRLVTWPSDPYQDKQGPTGLLFPPDATPHATAWWSFALGRDQELPRLEPGAIVDVEHVKPHESVRLWAGKLEMFSAQRVRAVTDGSPRFAERVLALGHPAVVGWTFRNRGPLACIETAEHALERDTGFRRRNLQQRARHEALRLAERGSTETAEPMIMDFVWRAGTGHGPDAVARLWPVDADLRSPPAIDVHVLNVPKGFDPAPGVPANVHRIDARAPFIRTPGAELWPDGFATLST